MGCLFDFFFRFCRCGCENEKPGRSRFFLLPPKRFISTTSSSSSSLCASLALDFTVSGGITASRDVPLPSSELITVEGKLKDEVFGVGEVEDSTSAILGNDEHYSSRQWFEVFNRLTKTLATGQHVIVRRTHTHTHRVNLLGFQECVEKGEQCPVARATKHKTVEPSE